MFFPQKKQKNIWPATLVFHMALMHFRFQDPHRSQGLRHLLAKITWQVMRADGKRHAHAAQVRGAGTKTKDQVWQKDPTAQLGRLEVRRHPQAFGGFFWSKLL